MKKRTVEARIPVELEFPDEMDWAIIEVLNGEYESGYFGKNLIVLDLGANIGSFSIWANLRWPNSQIHAYEPHPETFKTLTRNVAEHSNITCHNAAVYPSDQSRELFWSRYTGDGESGLVDYISEYFEDLTQDHIFEVPILPPRNLPLCDVVKLDVEGAEVLILENMNLEQVSLVLAEYHSDENRDRIKELLCRDFIIEYENSSEWDKILPNSNYKKNLSGDHYGTIFFINKNTIKLRKSGLHSPYFTRHQKTG